VESEFHSPSLTDSLTGQVRIGGWLCGFHVHRRKHQHHRNNQNTAQLFLQILPRRNGIFISTATAYSPERELEDALVSAQCTARMIAEREKDRVPVSEARTTGSLDRFGRRRSQNSRSHGSIARLKSQRLSSGGRTVTHNLAPASTKPSAPSTSIFMKSGAGSPPPIKASAVIVRQIVVSSS